VAFVGVLALYGLLFTIVLLFAIQGDAITGDPLAVVRIALPLLAYFGIMWCLGFGSGRSAGFPYAQTASLSFTVASNDFELAIAVAVGVAVLAVVVDRVVVGGGELEGGEERLGHGARGVEKALAQL